MIKNMRFSLGALAILFAAALLSCQPKVDESRLGTWERHALELEDGTVISGAAMDYPLLEFTKDSFRLTSAGVEERGGWKVEGETLTFTYVLGDKVTEAQIEEWSDSLFVYRITGGVAETKVTYKRTHNPIEHRNK